MIMTLELYTLFFWDNDVKYPTNWQALHWYHQHLKLVQTNQCAFNHRFVSLILKFLGILISCFDFREITCRDCSEKSKKWSLSLWTIKVWNINKWHNRIKKYEYKILNDYIPTEKSFQSDQNKFTQHSVLHDCFKNWSKNQLYDPKGVIGEMNINETIKKKHHEYNF